MSGDRFFLGLGGNVGDPAATLGRAIEELEAAGVRIPAKSPMYRTAAVGRAVRPFWNAALVAKFGGPGDALLDVCQQVERTCGRRPAARWDDRPLDVDIVLGDSAVQTKRLTVPHEMLAVRRFVLDPLADVAGDEVDPRTGRSISALARHWRRPVLRVFFGDGVPPREGGRFSAAATEGESELRLRNGPGVSAWPPFVDLGRVPMPTLEEKRDAILSGVKSSPELIAAPNSESA